jgi:hypothetical protein
MANVQIAELWASGAAGVRNLRRQELNEPLPGGFVGNGDGDGEVGVGH